MPELFSEKQWVGQFFVKGSEEKPFSGKVEYSPEHGVMLTCTVIGHEVPESDTVYGVLDSGDKCTLIGGDFKGKHFGITLKNEFCTKRGKIGFSSLVIGDFVEPDELFSDYNFSLTNLQEFFFPKGYEAMVSYSNSPLLSLKTSYGEISIGNSASFVSVGKDITTHIYSDNEQARLELQKAFEEINEKFSDCFFSRRKSLVYSINLKIVSGETIQRAYEYIRDIANMFAILIYNPVYPDKISVLKKNSNDHLVNLEVYPSIVLDKRTIGLCIKNTFHYNMPTYNSLVNLTSTLNKWLENPRLFPTVVSGIQNETGFRDEHSLHGEIVLYASQLEYISQNELAGNDQKYEYALNKYGCEKVLNGMRKILVDAAGNGLGKEIGNLRNEITHVGRPKKLLRSLSMQNLVHLSHYLQIIILAYILTAMGIDKDVITRYQTILTPDI